MSGKIKIGGLVFGAALVVLWAWFAFGQSNQDPCGGHYAGEGLKAAFLNQYWDYELNTTNPIPILWTSNITNGNASFYQYKVPGGDCVFLYRNGHVIVGVGWPLNDPDINHDRYVNMKFDYKDGGSCKTVAPLEEFMYGSVVPTAAIQFWTGNGFTATRPNGKLLLTNTNALLNFGTLSPENTYYCQIMVRFKVPGYEEEFRFDTQVKVYYGTIDNGGIGWEITPIHESYDVQLVTKVGKKLVPYGDPIPHESSVYHQELGSSFGACYGQFYFPFKLVLERLR
jgi:hypothetical protein